MKAETVIGPVTIVEKRDRPYAGIRLRTPFPGMFAVATRALKDLRAWSKANGLAEDGPYFLRYYHCDMNEIMDIEAGVVTGGRLRQTILTSSRACCLAADTPPSFIGATACAAIKRS